MSTAAADVHTPPPEVVVKVCPLIEDGARTIGVVVRIPDAPATMEEAEVLPRRFGIGPCHDGRLFSMTNDLPPPGWTEVMRCVDGSGATLATFSLRVEEGSAELCDPP